MIRRAVVFLPGATADIGALDDWIADRAGEDVAAGYIDRLETFAASLGHFPHRGTPRRLGDEEFRSITFERRQVVLYRVTPTTVEIVRVLDGRRDWEHPLPD